MANNLLIKSAILTAILIAISSDAKQNDYDEEFERWKVRFGRTYKNRSEQAKRYAIFRQLRAKINAHNADQNRSYDMELNGFSDWTREEFLMLMGKNVGSEGEGIGDNNNWTPPAVTIIGKSYPITLDFRSLLGQAERQGDIRGRAGKKCGACYAFSATAGLACRRNLKLRRAGKKVDLAPLSAQQIVDCSTAHGNNGCAGGNPANAYIYLTVAGGINKAVNYRYTTADGKCHFRKNDKNIPISGYTRVVPVNDAAMVQALQSGCVVVAMDTNESFRNYKSGIYKPKDPCLNRTSNHNMVIVGYTKDAWIVRNSWGPNWGQKGHVYVARNPVNICAILNFGMYPNLL